MLKIVYGGNRYYNHDPRQGFAYDHSNFYDSLRRIGGVRVIYYEYDRVKLVGKEGENREILELVRKEKPDLFLSIMYHEDLTIDTLKQLRDMTTTVGFFMDDQWHFHNSSKKAAPYLSWIATTYSRAVPWYRALGCANVIRTHLGANHHLFKPPKNADPNRFTCDVSFVGGWYPHRERVIKSLENAGIRVAVWGPGWPNGRLLDERMVPLVHETKINIDINPPSSHMGLKPFARFFFRLEADGIKPDFWNVYNNIREWWQKRTPMIKPRTFNTLAARSFVITQMTHDLSDYYEIGKEIVAYASVADLIDKIKYYLMHEEEREAIAEAGYQRTLKDHTYERRFLEIFKKIGVK